MVKLVLILKAFINNWFSALTGRLFLQVASWRGNTTTRTKTALSLQDDSLGTAGLQRTETGSLVLKPSSCNRIISTVIVALFCWRYWNLSHFQAIDVVLKALEVVYGSEKPSLTSAAMRWMHHHSHLKVGIVLRYQQGHEIIHVCLEININFIRLKP